MLQSDHQSRKKNGPVRLSIEIELLLRWWGRIISSWNTKIDIIWKGNLTDFGNWHLPRSGFQCCCCAWCMVCIDRSKYCLQYMLYFWMHRSVNLRTSRASTAFNGKIRDCDAIFGRRLLVLWILLAEIQLMYFGHAYRYCVWSWVNTVVEWGILKTLADTAWY